MATASGAFGATLSAVRDRFAERLAELAEDDPPVSIEVAAEIFNRKPHTVAEWIRQGAPVERKGRKGPGNRALVRVSRLRVWKALRRRSREVLEVIEDAAMQAIGGTVEDEQIIHRWGISEAQAAALAILITSAASHQLTGKAPNRVSESGSELLRLASDLENVTKK